MDNEREAAAGQVWRIGEWLADPASNELRRGQESVHIESKAMEVLVLLARQAGGVVGREELLARVWPRVVVGDDTLTQAVIKLRKALGDEARAPTYIETIPKRGYRLVAEAGLVDGTRTEPPMVRIAGPGESPAPRPTGRGPILSAKWRRGGLAVLVAGLLVAPVWWGMGDWRDTSLEIPDTAIPANDNLPTITVMPLRLLDDDSRHAYLAHGITADLMTDLSRLAGLRVISPAGDGPGSARYLVSGDLQRRGERLKLNIRLVDTNGGQQLWSERFDRAYRDLFAVQDEIARRLVETLAIQVSQAERRRLSTRYTRSLDAYDHFLQARAALLARQPDENIRARELYRQAIALDPAFARAYAGVALTYAEEFRLQWTANGGESLRKARRMAESARQIDPNIREVYWTLAYVSVQEMQHGQAIADLKRAIALDRAYDDAYAQLAAIHNHLGNPAKAIAAMRVAMRLSPNPGHLYYLQLGRAYFFLGDFEQALINLRESAARNPADIEVRIYLTAALAANGNRAEAEWEAEEIRVNRPGFLTRQWLKTYPMAHDGQRRRLAELLSPLGL